jgi:hypothetical protein
VSCNWRGLAMIAAAPDDTSIALCLSATAIML